MRIRAMFLFICLALCSSITVFGQDLEPVKKFSSSGGAISCLSFDPLEEYIASGDLSGRVTLWEIATGRRESEFRVEGSVNALCFSHNGRLIACGGDDKRITIFSADQNARGKIIMVLVDSVISDEAYEKLSKERQKQAAGYLVYPSDIRALAFTFDDKYLISGHADNTIKLWEVSTGERVRVMSGHKWDVQALAVDSATGYVFSAGADNFLKRWDIREETPKRNYTGHIKKVNDVLAVSGGGSNRIVSAGNDKTIRLWDYEGNLKYTVEEEAGAVRTLAIDGKGQMLASGAETNLCVWFLAGDRMVKIGSFSVSRRAALVNDLVFSKSGQYIFTATSAGELFMWDIYDYWLNYFYKDKLDSDCRKSKDYNTKGEFESEQMYVERQAKYRDSLMYQVYEKSFQSDLATWKATVSGSGVASAVTNPDFDVKLRVKEISNYYPEDKDQFFHLTLEVTSPKTALGKTVSGRLYIPRSEAPAFKSKYKLLSITGRFINLPNGLWEIQQVVMKSEHDTYQFPNEKDFD